MNHHGSTISVEKPLLGAILCCTSLSPEERTTLADYAQQMGAEHKLDLTSDVTHLIVGSTNTPKYQYVARERGDVKVLRPQWIKAVRECWMEDRRLDMNALEAEYRVPTFAGLKICITGFDELTFRAELANNVRKNGGEYTGDLTKDVTHLIAYEPVGKKFEYATAWQKKVVSLKWFQHSLSRGMQLDESKYHPSLHPDQQGVGAWNRQSNRQSVLGKRTNSDGITQEPARKIRRAASSKFNSQNENIWGDIVSKASDEGRSVQARDTLRPSKSMPVMHANNPGPNDAEPSMAKSEKSDRCLAGLLFQPDRFDDRKRTIITSTLISMGAQVFSTLSDLLSHDGASAKNCFIIAPHQSKLYQMSFLDTSPMKLQVVTELWLERCMVEKTFISPKDYPLGGLIKEVPQLSIESFSLNATGFPSIETLHISKASRVTGFQYNEHFTPKTSVLVCHSKNVNQSKVAHAKEWGVAVVTENWLWELLTSGSLPNVQDYLLHSNQGIRDDLDEQFRRNRQKALQPGLVRSEREREFADPGDGFALELARNILPNRRDTAPSGHTTSHAAFYADREDCSKHSDAPAPAVTAEERLDKRVLKEVSPNSPTKRSGAVAGCRKVSPSGRNSVDSQQNYKQKNQTSDEQDRKLNRTDSAGKSSDDITHGSSIVKDFLDMKARAKAAPHDTENETTGRNKKRLFGRALSNLSNSSRTSNNHRSRASSIDSLNTDGVGSELAAPSAGSRHGDRPASQARANSFSLTGRAQRSSRISTGYDGSRSLDLSDPNLCRDEYDETDLGPQLTQLGYEDSEEAIALRQRLAEKRRALGKLGHQDSDLNSEVPTSLRENVKKRVIKDDETVLALEGQAGWAGGRRTRQREKQAAADGVRLL